MIFIKFKDSLIKKGKMVRKFSEHQKKYLSILILIFYASVLSGCNSSSKPERPQLPINLIDQTFKNAKIKSRKYKFPSIQLIDPNELNSAVIKDNTGKEYGIIFRKIEPISHGTIEIKFRLTESKEIETGQVENLTKKNPANSNFAGIGFSTRNEKKPYMVLIDQAGKLTVGKTGEEPLITRQVAISESTLNTTRLKVSFMHDYLIVFIDGIPYIRLEKLEVKDIEIVSIVAKYFPESEKKLHLTYDKSGIKYRVLEPISEMNSRMRTAVR